MPASEILPEKWVDAAALVTNFTETPTSGDDRRSRDAPEGGVVKLQNAELLT